MNDWKEIALDDILDEMDKVAEEGEKQFENESQDRCGTVIKYVPFCCVTTIPKGFTIPDTRIVEETESETSEKGAITAAVAWNPCLNLRLKRESISVNACEGNAPCGSIPACITKVSGCIQFIASAPVKGGSESSNSSNICCKGCVCVDECVRCQLLQNSVPCPNDLGAVTVEVVDQKACIKPCKPCYSWTPSGTSTVVKFSGRFKITYTPPRS